jgi:hypothetical protein
MVDINELLKEDADRPPATIADLREAVVALDAYREEHAAALRRREAWAENHEESLVYGLVDLARAVVHAQPYPHPSPYLMQ